MTQYSSQTVANLRALLKSRGIPCTGLTRKQQIIDKLVEADNQLASASAEQNDEETKEDPPDQNEDEKDHANSDETQPTNIIEVRKHTSALEPTAELHSVKARNDHQQISDQSGKSEDSRGFEQHSAIRDHNDAQTQESPKPKQGNVEEQKNEANLERTPAVPVANNAVEAVSKRVEEAAKPVPREDVEDDAKKRKRRSVTPSVSGDDIAKKRLRQSPSKDIVHLESDSLKADNANRKNGEIGPDTANKEDDQVQRDTVDISDPNGTAVGVKKDQEKSALKDSGNRKSDSDVIDNIIQGSDAASSEIENRQRENLPPPQTGSTSSEKAQNEGSRDGKTNNEAQDISPETADTSENKLISQPNGLPSSKEDKIPVEDAKVAPAHHTPTSALYIRNFMRPLQPGSLKEHLLKLAVSEGPSTSDDLIQDFFIDSIRTHCFVSFNNVDAARRVRAALHNQIWPEESSRRPLWVDYIPREKVTDWIKVEQQNTIGKSGVSIRWEVVYEESNDGTFAILREIGSGQKDSYNLSNQRELSGIDIRGASGRQEAQDLKSSKEQQQNLAKPSEAPTIKSEATSKNFLALDSLFKSTTAKPKLYYLPVSNSLADERLKELHKLTQDDKPRRYAKSDELYRYTFANGTIINDGPDRPPRRAPRPGRRRGFGGRGAYAPRWSGRGRYP